MGIYQAKPGTPKSQLMVGGGTDNAQYAAVDPTTKQPIQNGPRQVWVSETALTTALNTSYMASQLGLFGIVVGIALLLSGFGFAILAIGGALRNPATALGFLHRSSSKSSRGARGISARLRRRTVRAAAKRPSLVSGNPHRGSGPATTRQTRPRATMTA